MPSNSLSIPGPERQALRRFWLTAAVLVVLFFSPNLALAIAGPNNSGPFWFAAANLLTCAIAALACFQRGRREPEARAGWFLLALAALTASLCQVQTLLAAAAGQPDPPYPGVGDWASILAVPLGGVGLLCFPLRPTSLGKCLRLTLDSLLFATSLLFLLLVIAYDREIQVNHTLPGFRDATALQLALVVVDLAVVLFLVRNNPACLQGPVGILTGGLVASAIPALLALRHVVSEDAYGSGHLVHVLYSAALLALCVAALSPWPVRPSSPSWADLGSLKLIGTYLPYVPFVGLVLVGLSIMSGNPLIIWSGLVAFLLIPARLTLALFDYWELARSLEDRVRERTRQLEESQARLAQAERLEALGRLAGGVAHDFNNLLTVILGYAQFLRDSLPDNDPGRDLVVEISRAGERAGSLTRQLLTFARKQPISPLVFSPTRVVEQIQRLLKRTIGENIALTVRGDPEVGYVKMDPHQFEQVALNLALNARDAMPEGGSLLIETTRVLVEKDHAARYPDAHPGPHVRLRVHDTGNGISAETMSHIFDPFFTTKEQGKGTGLGLAICYGIVKEAGGHILVATALGQGTTFDVYLPLTEELPEVPRVVPPKSASQRGKGTILVAEDEPVVRKMVADVLHTAGYVTLLAKDGLEAVELARSHPARIELFLTDMIMPGLSGIAAAKEVRAYHPETEVLVMSGYSADAIENQQMLSEQIPFLPKPVTPHVLAQRVRELIGS
jgi:signal transduction histidine kinase